MIAFSHLAEALLFDPSEDARAVHLAHYLAAVPVADGAAALSVLTGRPRFAPIPPAAVKALAARLDPVLFAFSRRFVGDVAETVALMWPPASAAVAPPGLAAVVAGLGALRAADAADILAGLMAGLDAGARRILLLMATDRLRVHLPAAVVAAALAQCGGRRESEDLRAHLAGAAPPFAALIAFARGDGPCPAEPGLLLPPAVRFMPETCDPSTITATWFWDGPTVLLRIASGETTLTGPDGEALTGAFPECAGLSGPEALVVADLTAGRDGQAAAGLWRARLGRRRATPAARRSAPLLLKAFDILSAEGEDLRDAPLAVRRAALERVAAALDSPHLTVSSLLPVGGGPDAALAGLRVRARSLAGTEAGAVAGVRLAERRAPWRGATQPWTLWPAEPESCRAVLLYGERAAGRGGAAGFARLTVGVWRGAELVPVGQVGDEALAGADAGLLEEIAAFMRTAATGRFGPVREVVHSAAEGMVLRIAYAGLDPAPRRKAGIVLRGATLLAIETGLCPAQADRLEDLAG